MDKSLMTPNLLRNRKRGSVYAREWHFVCAMLPALEELQLLQEQDQTWCSKAWWTSKSFLLLLLVILSYCFCDQLTGLRRQFQLWTLSNKLRNWDWEMCMKCWASLFLLQHLLKGSYVMELRSSEKIGNTCWQSTWKCLIVRYWFFCVLFFNWNTAHQKTNCRK